MNKKNMLLEGIYEYFCKTCRTKVKECLRCKKQATKKSTYGCVIGRCFFTEAMFTYHLCNNKCFKETETCYIIRKEE